MEGIYPNVVQNSDMGIAQGSITTGLCDPAIGGLLFNLASKQRRGWVCPVCSRGVSPDLQNCPCVNTAMPYSQQGLQQQGQADLNKKLAGGY